MAGWWFGTFSIFHNIWDVILPIDELIFLKMVKPINPMAIFTSYVSLPGGTSKSCEVSID